MTTAHAIRLHNYHVYLFAGTTLVTVMDLPGRYQKAYAHAKRKKEKRS